MKAAVYEGIEQIIVREVPDPSVSPDYPLKIKVDACAICGSDVRTYHHGKSNVVPPQIIGHEVAGTVVEVLDGFKSPFSPGDRVTVAAVVSCGECYYCRRGIQNRCENFTAIGYEHPGGFAQYMVVPSKMVLDGSVNRIPDHVAAKHACIAEPLACVINGQELSSVGLGQNVVIIGAGPIGCMHVALAKALGAAKVILCEVSQPRLEMAKAFGADVYINPANEDAVQRVKEETEGRGADVVIVAAPSGAAQEQALRMAAKRGRVNFFGGLPKDKPTITLDSNLVHYNELFVHGAADSTPRQNRIAAELIASGRINAQALVTHTVPLEGITEGIGIAERGEGLKVVVEPWS
ncbi:MAG: zinc-dependent dehydrogenase [Armatimonadota bacterium]